MVLSLINSLIDTQRNVIPYPINYSYVTGEGFTDLEKGIEWCTDLQDHTTKVQELFTELSSSLDELKAIENKTDAINVLIEDKYEVLAKVMIKEIKSLQYKSFQVDCDDVLEYEFDIPIILQ